MLPPLPDQPFVTVISTSYNHGSFLEETIHSVLTQDYDPIELIIVDGGSTDGTLDILRKYQHDSRVRWISEPDSGPYEAFNKGLLLAKGNLVGVMPVTDIYLPGAIPEMVREFVADQRLVFVGGWTQVVDEDGIPTGDRQGNHIDRFNYSLDDILKFASWPKDQASLRRLDIALAIGGYSKSMDLPNSIFHIHYMLEASKWGGNARAVPKMWATFRVHTEQRHSSDSALQLILARNDGFKRLAKLYRNYLTRKQLRLLRRTGYYLLLRYRVRKLHQIIPAIPTALGYIRFGGGLHIVRKLLPYLVFLGAARIRTFLK